MTGTRQSLTNFVHTTFLAIPLALLAGEGAVFVAGVVYAVGYGLLLLPPTALHILALVDSLRVLSGRGVVFAPLFEAMASAAERRPMREPRFAPLLRLGITGHPLGVFTREVWMLALRFHPETPRKIEEQAARIATQMEDSGITGRLVAEEFKHFRRHTSELELASR